MLSVKGIYENKQLHLLEPVPHKKRVKVIVTFLEDLSESEENENEVDLTDRFWDTYSTNKFNDGVDPREKGL